jgi:hypothetical protein
MRRYLLVALWPAGLAAIAAATVLAARRAPASRAQTRGPAAANPADPAAARSAGIADQAAGNGTLQRGIMAPEEPGRAPSAAAAASIRRAPDWLSKAAAPPDWVPDLIRLGALGAAGGIVSYRVMALLGPPVVNHGLVIDEPIFRWTHSHQVDWWAAFMTRLNKVGNVWTTWGAVGTAAVCLGVSWRKQRWLPPAALGAAMLVDHSATHALHRNINRLGPPTNPLGTYPAGGTDRVILFYGLIAHMLWREFSGSRRGKIWATGAVAGLAYSQAYCREYLSQHWFIDIVCGLFYGAGLLVPFIVAVRLIAGPAEVEAERRQCVLAAAPG